MHSITLYSSISNTLTILSKQPKKEIKFLLNKEADIPTKQLKISVNDGVVLLDGTIETRLQADRVVEIANSVDNVRDVDTYKLKVTSYNQYLMDAFIRNLSI